MPRRLRIEPLKPDVLLAFAFGTIFCGVLAYASLRSAPIAGPNFFFLKVLSALSAAGVAAVIPGMINLELGKGTVFAVRAAGAIAIFVLVFKGDAPALVSGDMGERAKMHGNFAGGLYDDAGRRADELLRKNPNDDDALNIKGGIAFYRKDYATAATLFRRALEHNPSNTIVVSNYANALVETGDFDTAIELFQSIDDGRPDRAFTLGRAYLYAGRFSEADFVLERVPPGYWRGAGRVLQAAALVGRSLEEQRNDKREEFLVEAREAFLEGYEVEKNYWDGIFSGGSNDVHLSYDLPISLLGSIYDEIAAAN